MYHLVIPARFGSTRLPGKALADIHGKPMVWWVWQRALSASAASVVVATDDQRIADVMTTAGADVALTSAEHPSGTDRLAQVAVDLGWSDDEVVVNLQGDEPMMPVANLEQVARDLLAHPSAAMTTLCEPINSVADFVRPDVVKVVKNATDEALYFSRAPIPCDRGALALPQAVPSSAHRHLGLYAYRVSFLKQFVTYPPAPLEQLEQLEQLRALHYGHRIRILQAVAAVPAGVDTAEDLERVRGLLREVTL